MWAIRVDLILFMFDGLFSRLEFGIYLYSVPRLDFGEERETIQNLISAEPTQKKISSLFSTVVLYNYVSMYHH